MFPGSVQPAAQAAPAWLGHARQIELFLEVLGLLATYNTVYAHGLFVKENSR